MTKPTSAEGFRLLSSFESIRKTLLDDQREDRMGKPLAYWARPSDRRLPLALLGRTVGELLATPFEEISATPGIGYKKIGSLVKLLRRAAEDAPSGESEEDDRVVGRAASGNGHAPHSSGFDPALVSEAHWNQWVDTVRRHELGRERLGRLAPSLRALPTVIWEKPLGFYLGRTLEEIRNLKTHGEKRVRVVLEVFHVVHETLASVPVQSQLAVRLVPRFVMSAERWFEDIGKLGEAVSIKALKEHLAKPLVAQIEIDAGPTVHEIVKGRVGLDSAPKSVRAQSREMGVTRARVYQLLEDCTKIMHVRWPEGRCYFKQLSERLASLGADDGARKLLHSLRELFFPDKEGRTDEADH